MITYDERPWLRNYDAGVPTTLEPYPSAPLHYFLRESALKSPNQAAIITPAAIPVLGFQSNVVTYQQLDAASDALAAGLIAMGLKKGGRVAIILPNSTAFAISYFGVLKAGGVVAAANPTYPAPKMQHQINDCEAEFVIVLSLFYGLVQQIRNQTKVKTVIMTNIKEYLPMMGKVLFTIAKEKKDGHKIDELRAGDYWLQDILSKYAGQRANVDVQTDDRALLQYTGGTTGISKGAILTHSALVANTLQIQAWSSVLENVETSMTRSNMLYLGAIPMFHVFGLVVLLSHAIASGSKIVVVANARDIDTLVAVIDHYKPNVFLGVPAMYNAVVNHPRIKSGEVKLDSFVLSSSGAAPLPPATKREYEAAGAKRLNEGYGMSETSAASHSNPLLGLNKVGSVGMPLPDMEVRM